MTSPATAPPVSAASGLSTRPTIAVPARPARGKARNPAVQINQVRRNHGVDAAGPVAGRVVGRVMVGQLLGPAGAGCVGAGVRGSGTSGLSETDRLASGLRRLRTVTPRAATHSPQPVLPISPARPQTGKPGTAVARTSPWLSRYTALTATPAIPSQRGSTRLRRMTRLRVTDQPMANSWPRCSPRSAPPNWCWAVQAASTAALVVASPPTYERASAGTTNTHRRNPINASTTETAPA